MPNSAGGLLKNAILTILYGISVSGAQNTPENSNVLKPTQANDNTPPLLPVSPYANVVAPSTSSSTPNFSKILADNNIQGDLSADEIETIFTNYFQVKGPDSKVGLGFKDDMGEQLKIEIRQNADIPGGVLRLDIEEFNQLKKDNPDADIPLLLSHNFLGDDNVSINKILITCNDRNIRFRIERKEPDNTQITSNPIEIFINPNEKTRKFDCSIEGISADGMGEASPYLLIVKLLEKSLAPTSAVKVG